MTHFLGNKTDKIVHDLWNEKPRCDLWRLKRNERAYFIPDTLAEARTQGFAACPYCTKTPARKTRLAAPLSLTPPGEPTPEK